MSRSRLMRSRGELSVPDRHQLRLARDTLKMRPEMAPVMGGMTVPEARAVIARFSRRSNPPPARMKISRKGESGISQHTARQLNRPGQIAVHFYGLNSTAGAFRLLMLLKGYYSQLFNRRYFSITPLHSVVILRGLRNGIPVRLTVRKYK